MHRIAILPKSVPCRRSISVNPLLNALFIQSPRLVVFVTALFSALLLQWFLWPLEQMALDGLFQLRGSRPVPSGVMLAAIDDIGAERLNLLPHDRSPWPRTFHARLIDQLRLGGARAVIFDMRFSLPQTPENDAAMQHAMGEFPSVVLFENVDLQQDAGQRWVNAILTPPLTEFQAVSRANGPFLLPQWGTQVRDWWPWAPMVNFRPTLPVLAAHLHWHEQYFQWRQAINPLLPQTQQFPEQLPRNHSDQVIQQVKQHFLLYPEAWILARRQLGSQPHLRPWLEMYDPQETLRMLDFYGPPGTIPTYRVDELLIDPSVAADHTVFVGYVELPFQSRQIDSFLSSFADHRHRHSGVEIAATAFANLLEQRQILPLSVPMWLLLTGVWSVLLAFCLSAKQLRWILLGVPLLAMVYGVVVWGVFSVASYWLPVVTPLFVQLPVALLIALWWRSHEGQRLKFGIGQYFPTWVVEDLAQGTGHTHRGESHFAVCLASDLQDYTQLAEGMNPAGLREALNEYYGALFQPVREHDGFISDIIGDAMLALWSRHPDPQYLCQQAVRAAVAIKAVNLCSLPLRTRLGMHCGEVVLGAVGDASHREYRAVGDAVNAAARIQDLNKRLGTQFLVSDPVLSQVPNVIARRMGQFRFKGKQQALTIWEVWREGELLKPHERRLVALFAKALGFFESGHWESAEALFCDLIRDFGDPPSQFYRKLCVRFAEYPPLDWQGVIDVAQLDKPFTSLIP